MIPLSSMAEAIACTSPAGFTEALALATVAHQGQVNKFDGERYILHVHRVIQNVYDAHRLETKDSVEDLLTVAALHDVVEDTDVRLSHLVNHFSWNVMRGVDSVTRREDETYRDFIKRATKDPIGKHVKLADLRDHLSRPTPKPGMSTRYKEAYACLLASGAF